MSINHQALPAGTVLRGSVYTYTIEKVLGQGSFGITYLASTSIKGPLGEVTVPVAVKEFFASELDSRRADGSVVSRTEQGVAHKYAKAFQRESQNLSKMKHPGIVKVLEAFQTNGTYYYSMEYLSGGSLDDKVKGNGIPEAEALPMIKKIGEALAFMHGRKMMHLDLKPKNIMLKADGTPVIIDFGLSKQYDNSGEPESSTTIGLGTPGYAPIEQATQTTSGEFQPTLDIYALGATLFKMLTGATPPAATLVLNKKATLAHDLQSKNVSSGTVDSIRKAMAPLMDDRPQRVEDFLSMLVGKNVEPEEVMEDETEPKLAPKPTAGHAQAKKPSVILSGSEESKGKPKTWLWVLLGGLAVLAVILAFVFGGKGRSGGAGGDSGADTLSVSPSDLRDETPAVPPVTEPAPDSPGSVKVTSEPSGASIWLDGKDTKLKTPEILEEVTPGKHGIRLVLDGYQEYRGSVTVSSGQRASVSRKLGAIQKQESEPSERQPVSSGGTGTSVSSNTINGHEWVDLGLSVKWATCNVGASSPSDYGSYFAWGETRTKSAYEWENYKFRVSGNTWENVTFSKYNTQNNRGTVDNKTRLDLSDDAARANWGGSWRMPTKAEQDELRAKCTWTWTTQGGKTGYKVTGKNGNSIFLPAAGLRHGASLLHAGSHGGFWSSSLPSDYPDVAYYLSFYSGNVDWYSNGRYGGFPVRPVSE